MAQRLSIRTNNRTLTSLLNYIKQGSIQVPQFQRGFVWDRDNVKKLFDSINRGYPVGTVFLWKPEDQTDGVKESKLGAYTIPNGGHQEYYVLDGYQRLSTLFNCLINYENTDLEFKEIEWNKYFNLYYDALNNEFIYLGRKQTPKYCQFPLRVMLIASDFRKYYREHLEKECKDENELEDILDNADRFCSRLLDYAITCTEIENADISQASDIFSRINKEGTKVSIDWMVHALSSDEDFNLANITDELLESLQKYHFEDISRNTIFRCFQSSFDNKIFFDQDKNKIERLAKEKRFKEVIVDQSVPAIKKAVQFLYEELHVIDRKLLPYNIQLVFFMEFFRRIETPSDDQKRWLKEWFWKTTYSSFFTNGSLGIQRDEYDEFLNYLDTGKYKNRDISKLLFPVVAPYPLEFNIRGARSSALALFVINHLFEQCSDILYEPEFRQTSISPCNPVHAPKCTLFTNIEAQAYNRLFYQKGWVYSQNNLFYNFRKEYDESILSASFFDINDLGNLEEREYRMKGAETRFLETMGFGVDDKS